MLDDIMNMEVRYLGDLNRVALKDGDMLVLQTRHQLDEKQIKTLKSHLEQTVPGHKVLVLAGDVQIGVLSKEDQC